ncbi:dihydrolipoamide dehydrogenase [Winogradskyella sp. PC D3.3]
MKKIASLLFVVSLILTSCTGEQGPPGYDGYDGQDGLDGVNFVGQSFERTIDFLPPNYEQYIVIPSTIELFETDMTLVYVLWEQDPVTGNDVWRLIPQTVFTDSGELFQYNYDYSFDEVRLFIDAPLNFDRNNLSTAATLNQTFRIVVLPVDFIDSINLDVTNYNDVIEYLQ